MKKFIKKYYGLFFATVGSFIMACSWNWYHIKRRPIWKAGLKTFLLTVAVMVVFFVAKKIFIHVLERYKRHPFWKEQLPKLINQLFLIFSLAFLIFFIRHELFSLIYSSLILFVLFWWWQRFLKLHPAGEYWLKVNRLSFIFAYFIFVTQAINQYAAYHYYILDNNIRFFNIVLFRSIAMSLFWLLGFALASWCYGKAKNAMARYVPITLWSLLFIFTVALWVVNIGILYYSGLYFSPTALEHAKGSAGVALNAITFYLIFAAFITLVGFGFLLARLIKAHRAVPHRYWSYYTVPLIFIAGVALAALTSFRNTPEHAIARSFYDYFFGANPTITLTSELQTKLSKFGLKYDTDAFYVNSRNRIYASTTVLMPERFAKQKPNILIIFLESFSTRLTSVYNSRFKGLTPGLEQMANDPHTTIFKKYYNASTPTITGTLSQLCSFLPPTGHNEIQNERKLQNHHLLCLPEALKKYAGYGYAGYVTAVDKEFAHKDGIFTSMSVDKIFGTSELKKYISGEPLAWGYSDHQMFPVVWQMMQERAANDKKPFLMMLATVDTHPPFNIAKDMVPYKNSRQLVLNSFHTTDDAFEKFWSEFKQSSLYNNTMVVAVADHAIFPAALTKDIFPTDAGQLTFYDENFFLTYIPDSVLPKIVDRYSSGLDFTPTLLQMLGVNIPNPFEGHSIFDDRDKYPNLLGMHELGLYINQVTADGKRKIDYNVPSQIDCPDEGGSVSSTTLSTLPGDLTLCEYLQFYKWKRQMFEQGRFWKQFNN